MSEILWHYTAAVPSHLGSILADGEIKRESECRTDCYIDPRIRKTDFCCRAVWFSTNPVIEMTAIKPYYRKDAGGFITPTVAEALSTQPHARIRIDLAPDIFPWREYVLRAPSVYMLTSKRLAFARELWRGLETAGIKQGADPAEWFACFERVPASRWKAIQVAVDGQWVDYVAPTVAPAVEPAKLLQARHPRRPIRFGQSRISTLKIGGR